MRIVSTATLLVALTATPCLADITAQDVWDSWKTLAGSYGQTITVENESYSGGVLKLTGITTSVALPDEGEVTGTLSDLVLTEQGDGTVLMTMPPEYPFSLAAKGAEGEDMSMAFRFVNEALKTVASGDPGAISYAFSAPAASLILDEITENGEPVNLNLAVALTELAGTYDLTAGTLQKVVSNFTAGAVDFTMAVDEPSEGMKLDVAATMHDVESTSSGALPMLSGGAQLAEMLRAGGTNEMRMTVGATQWTMNADDQENPFTMTGGSESSSFDMSLSPDGLAYGGGNTNVTMMLQLQNLPLPPFTFNMAESGGEIRMPLMASDEAKDFGFRMNLTGLEIGESAWMMVDPAGGLPRDPINLALDISGLARLAVDLFDPEAVEGMAGAPGSVDSVSINTLLLSALGAELTGAGAMTLDNSAMPPVPAGQVDLTLTGANGLIDNLIAVGLLPEDQAMGARMMLGLFARPGAGADELVSTIELKEDGSVMANGQRIK